MKVMRRFAFCLLISSSVGLVAVAGQTPGALEPGAKAPVFEAREIRRDFGVGYAVTTGDMNGDKKPDVIAISGTQLVWFENPSWTQHVVLDGQTPKDNVALAPQDIDGDGRLDVAIGAAWNPRDTNGGGTLHWVRQPGAGASAGASGSSSPWALIDIASEPTLHRIRWANVDGRGLPELIVAPLHGRGTSPPEWNGPGARLLVFSIPPKVSNDSKWPVEVADDTLHILHNFAVVRWEDDDDTRDDLITSSREGIHLLRRGAGADGKWTRTKIGEGAPGEIKLGRVAGRRVIATIEPWHGNSVVLYLEPEPRPAAGAPAPLWTRRVIEEQLTGGHALGWGDFDRDGDDELAVGWRDKEGGLALYDINRDGAVSAKHMIDAGGMATEDLTVADLDGDGRPDIAASGRRTANVKIYFNRGIGTGK
jgi:FG-GAP-like repeat